MYTNRFFGCNQSVLTGVEVCAVVFNEERSKMFEFCNTEPEHVFSRIASFNGYGERKRIHTVFLFISPPFSCHPTNTSQLRTPKKCYVNIADDPQLSYAALNAATMAAVRHSPQRVAAIPQKRNKHNNVKLPHVEPTDLFVGSVQESLPVPDLTLNAPYTIEPLSCINEQLLYDEEFATAIRNLSTSSKEGFDDNCDLMGYFPAHKETVDSSARSSDKNDSDAASEVLNYETCK